MGQTSRKGEKLIPKKIFERGKSRPTMSQKGNLPQTKETSRKFNPSATPYVPGGTTKVPKTENVTTKTVTSQPQTQEVSKLKTQAPEPEAPARVAHSPVPGASTSRASEADNDPALKSAAAHMLGWIGESIISSSPIWIDSEEAKTRFDECLSQVPFKVEKLGQGRKGPRLVYDYDPSGPVKAAKLMAREQEVPFELGEARNIRVLDALSRRIELDTALQVESVSCLHLRNGKDHSPTQSLQAEMFVLALGESRRHVFTPKEGEAKEFEMNSGDLLYVNSCASREYAHSIVPGEQTGDSIVLFFYLA